MFFLNISKTLSLNKFSEKFVLTNLLELFAISRVFDEYHLIKIYLVKVFITDNDVLYGILNQNLFGTDVRW